MSFVDGLRHRLNLLLRPTQHERDHSDELAFHLEREAAQHAHDAYRPMSGPEALAAARRSTGNLTQIQENTRSEAGLTWLDVLRQDIRFAIRSFRSTPAFTAIVVATLALGIGGTTAIFSAIDALLLRPLPFAAPQSLMSVSLTIHPPNHLPVIDDVRWSYPKFREFKRIQHVFSDASEWTQSQFTMRVGSASHRLTGEYTDSRYLPTLGIPLVLGRNFIASEDGLAGDPKVAILSHQLWRSVFSSDAAVIGKRVAVDGHSYEIVGVAAENFRGISGEASFWMPIASAPKDWGAADAFNHDYFMVARLADTVSVAQAKAAMPILGGQIAAVFPDRSVQNREWGAVARELDSARAHPQVRRTLLILLAAVGLVLLTACANVANLLLVRASSRQREIAVRLALGASRARLMRQLLAESLVLAAVGSLASITVAFVAVKLLAAVQMTAMGEINSAAGLGTVHFSAIQFDIKTFAATGVLAVVTAMLFGLAPALIATGKDVLHAIKDGDNTMSVGRRRFTLRHVLTVAEIAFAVVLLTASGLMIRSVNHLLDVPTGFDADHVLSLRINRAPEWARDSISVFYDGALERIGSQPGVREVAMSDCPPLVRCATVRISYADRPPVPPAERPQVGIHWVTPGLPALLRIPLLRGRMFTRGDDRSAPSVVLISETAAKKLWPGQDPLGHRILLDSDALRHDSATVIGVLGDVSYDPIEAAPNPDVYVSYFQSPLTFRMMFFVRAEESPAVTRGVLSTLAQYAPGFPVYDVRWLNSRVDDRTAYARVTTIILASFATVALILAMIGTYGVVAYSVSQRTREIGVRVALGATNSHISRLFAWQGATLAFMGLGVGLAIAIVATRALKSLLYDVTPSDPVTMAGIVLVLGGAVVAATWIPARRAMRVTPAEVLRNS